MIQPKDQDVQRRKQILLDSMPDYYQESPEVNAIMHGNAHEIERKRAEGQDLLNQMFVSTATWGLDYWDRVLDLEPVPRMSLKGRRSRILAKLNGVAPATRENLKNIVNAHLTKRSAKIYERNDQYLFEVEIDANETADFLEISKDLEEVKPAHLDYAFRQNTRFSLYYAAALSTGEEVSVYQWSPSKIETTASIHLGSFIYDYDTTRVYPQKGDI